jgi:hypothetical protein
MATTITNQTFPGVYAQVIDQSFLPAQTSTFLPGLIGVASKGPFNTPTPIASLSQFVTVFGNPITTTYTTASPAEGVAEGQLVPAGYGFFLADAVGILANLTDGITVVRVGNMYQNMPTPYANGVNSSTTVVTSGTNALYVNWMLAQGSQVYIAVSNLNAGNNSSVDLMVVNSQVGADGNGTLTLSANTPLVDTYQGATIVYSNQPDAAWSAESIVYGYGYDDMTSSIGAVYGDNNTIGVKGGYSFYIQTGSNALDTTSLYAITDGQAMPDEQPTYEFRVQSVAGNIVYMVSSDNTQIGYQAVPLQDNYTQGKLWKATSKNPFLMVAAASAGVWANGANSSQGVYVAVGPGTAQGTKKIEVYWNSALVETFDNLSANPTDPNFYTTAINGVSQYITIASVNTNYSLTSPLPLGTAGTHAASTVNPWNVAFYGTAASSQWAVNPPMPFGAINAGWLYQTVSTVLDTGCQFVNGYNGENAQPSDFVGVYNPDDTGTGLKCFENTDTVNVNMLSAPMDNIDVSVMQEMTRIAQEINAMAVADVPAGLNIWQAIDWHNGKGPWTGQGRINNCYLAVFWNWFTLTSPFDGLEKMVPPTLGALRCFAATFANTKPWRAAAGFTNGQIPEALSVEYTTISNDAKQAMFANGNAINPIWNTRGQFLVWGDRTMQVAQSKLQSIHTVNLVNWIVSGMSDIGIQFTFDPNDQDLLNQLTLAFTAFLDQIQNEQGLEQYALVCDSSNNTAATRNNREVIVNLQIIPTDVMERLLLYITVNSSGATLTGVA